MCGAWSLREALSEHCAGRLQRTYAHISMQAQTATRVSSAPHQQRRSGRTCAPVCAHGTPESRPPLTRRIRGPCTGPRRGRLLASGIPSEGQSAAPSRGAYGTLRSRHTCGGTVDGDEHATAQAGVPLEIRQLGKRRFNALITVSDDAPPLAGPQQAAPALGYDARRRFCHALISLD